MAGAHPSAELGGIAEQTCGETPARAITTVPIHPGMIWRVALAVLVLAAPAGNAGAAEVPAKAVVHPGTLSLTSVRDITSPSERRDGLLRMFVEVTDARGSGRGWTLRVRSVGAASQVIAISLRCGPESTCTLPPRPDLPTTMIEPDRTTSVLTSPRGAGMGRIDVTVFLAGAPLVFSLRPA